MSAAPMIRPDGSPQFVIEVVLESGKNVGKIYTFTKQKISLGREPDNDVILEDIKASRHHCEIKLTPSGIRIRNVSDKNVLFLNDNMIKEVSVNQPVKLTLGDTHLTVRYKIFNPEFLEQLSLAKKPKVFAKGVGSDWGRIRLYGIALLIGLIAYMYFSPETKKSEPVPVRSQFDVTKSIEQSISTIKDIEQKRIQTGQDTLQFQLAQQHYLKGFRDYRQGQYARSIQSFQAALSFFPNHDLSKKYWALAKRKFDGQIQQNMILGKRYLGKNNFRLCKSSFSQVMIMLKDINDPIFKEAKQLFDECSVRLEGGH
jgi:pSer/pThr/pTyr-binding forkhead associated (FHA) protein